MKEESPKKSRKKVRIRTVVKIERHGVPAGLFGAVAALALSLGGLLGYNLWQGPAPMPLSLIPKGFLYCKGEDAAFSRSTQWEPCVDKHGVPYAAYGKHAVEVMIWYEHSGVWKVQ